MNRLRLLFPTFVVIAFFCCSCNKNDALTGQLSLRYTLCVDDAPLVFDSMMYENAAHNLYEVNEVKFFISEVRLIKADGTLIPIQDHHSTHYYDSQISTTQKWDIHDSLPVGEYAGMVFTFGLPPAQNTTGFFVNPPENNMAWPEYLGGGYHYLQINGRWLQNGTASVPFNLHTGMGQVYEGDVITQFVPNHFTVTLSDKPFSIRENAQTQLTLTMDINQWFDNPHQFDLNVWGGSIMQNQAAQELLKKNGETVFK